MNIELSLEHIHPDLIDIPCEVDLDCYEGTTDSGSGHLNSEDPSELDIHKVTVLEKIEYVDCGVKYTIYPGDVLHCLDHKITEQIEEAYARRK